MSDLFFIALLVLAVNPVNGEIGPTFTCVTVDGNESSPPCKVNEDDSVVFVKVSTTQGTTTSQYALQGLFTEDPSTPSDPANEIAIAGKDYVPLNSPLPFEDTATASTEIMIPITILEDTQPEPTEEFLIDANFIQMSNGNLAVCTSYTIAVQIIDNDGDHKPIISLDASSYTVDEGDEVIVGITRSNDEGRYSVPVVISARAISASFDDFSFEINPTIVTVSSGATEILKFQTTADGDDETVEAFEIEILEDGSYIRGNSSRATVYIKDGPGIIPTYRSEESSTYQAHENQTPFTCNIERFFSSSATNIKPTLTCVNVNGNESPPPCRVNEDDSILLVKVTMAQGKTMNQYALQGLFTEDLSTPSDPANEIARAGKDYVPVKSPLPFEDTATASTEIMIPITILEDTQPEPTEEFLIGANFIQMSNGHSAVCTSYSLEVQIIDNDGDHKPIISLDDNFYTVDEGDEMIVGITRSNDEGRYPVPVGISASSISASFDDFAFEINPTIVTVSNGATEMLKIQTSAGGYNATVEVFEIEIMEDDSYIRGNPSKATVYIKDGLTSK